MKLKNMNHLFESSDDKKMTFYYQILTQDVLQISNNDALDWINELLLYLSNDMFYFNPTNSDNNVQFITMSKIKEKYV